MRIGIVCICNFFLFNMRTNSGFLLSCHGFLHSYTLGLNFAVEFRKESEHRTFLFIGVAF